MCSQYVAQRTRKNTFVSFMHELEQLVDDRLQELPVSLEEPWILANNVHNVACNHSFVVLTPNHLGKAQQFLYEID